MWAPRRLLLFLFSKELELFKGQLWAETMQDRLRYRRNMVAEQMLYDFYGKKIEYVGKGYVIFDPRERKPDYGHESWKLVDVPLNPKNVIRNSSVL